MMRDLSKLWPQFISVFLMALLSITIFTGLEGIWTGMEEVIDDYYEETNLCDIRGYGDFSDESKLEEFKNNPNIKDITRSIDYVVSCEINNTVTDTKMISIEDVSTLNPRIISGENFEKDKQGLFLDNEYAKQNNISLGDNIDISYNNVSHSIEVVALVANSEFIYYTGSSIESMPNPKCMVMALYPIVKRKIFSAN